MIPVLKIVNPVEKKYSASYLGIQRANLCQEHD